MKIRIVDNGYVYSQKYDDDAILRNDGLYFQRKGLEQALEDSDCDGVDYTQFCNGRVLTDAQQQTADFILQNKRCYVFNGMGTGKTMSSLMAILVLARIHPEYRFLIISSKTVLASAWVPEVENVCPYLPLVLAEGSIEKKRKIIFDREKKFVGISADSLHIVNKDKFDVIIADEATLFKGAQGVRGTKRGDCFCDLASSDKTDRLILMTGTPRAHNCMDAYGLYYIMNDKQRKYNIAHKCNNGENKIYNKTQFREKVCVPMTFRDFMVYKNCKDEKTWDNIKHTVSCGLYADLPLDKFIDLLNHAGRDAVCMWVERPNANEILLDLLSPAIAFRTEDVLDLPDCPIVDVCVDMTKEERDSLNLMKRKMIMQFYDKEDIIANRMVLEGKLEQMNCGVVYDSDRNGQVILPDVYNKVIKFVITRLQSLESDRGLVIASRYNHILNVIYSVCETILGEGSVNFIHGGVSSKLRTQYVKDFRSLKTRVLLANTACLSHGVTLVEAKEMILLDTPQYAEPYIQVKGRVHRRGQKWEIPIYRIISNAVVKHRFDVLEGAEDRDDDFVRLVTEDE